MLEVHTKEGVYYQQAKISECLEKMRPYGFAMPHKSFVVNLDQVRGIKGYEITMPHRCMPGSREALPAQ